MQIDDQRRLAEFVDREAEMARFCELLEFGPNAKRVLVISGDGGIGKSSLMARMLHECALQKKRRALIVWTDTRNHDYVAVMRSVRDEIGPTYFSAFTDLVNYFTVPRYTLTVKIDPASRLSIAEGMTVEGASKVGDIAGIVIKDSMLTFPRDDMAVPDAERIARLTDAFLEGLRSFAEREPLVVFLDAIEKMSEVTERWVWGELVEAIRCAQLPNTMFVLFGRKVRALGREWSDCSETAELRPLGFEDTVKYLERRGLPEAEREPVAQAWLVATNGAILPLQLATYVDVYLLQHKRVAAGR